MDRMLICSIAMAGLATGAFGQDGPERVALGAAQLITNDLIGDGRDRWRTGGFHYGLFYGPEFDGQRPERIGQLLEFRFRTEAITAQRAGSPAAPPADRRYAGVVALGLHSHFALGQTDVSLGADIVALGPQTGVSDIQYEFHDAFSIPTPDTSNEIPDQFIPTALAEVSRAFPVSESVTLRPFVEAQAGVEDFVRIGADVSFGQFGALGGLFSRDTTTGQLLRVDQGYDAGLSVLLGADVAAVGDSAFFPVADGLAPKELRTRLRGGVNRKGAFASQFFGLTYLGEEFEGQEEGQVVGSVALEFNF